MLSAHGGIIDAEAKVAAAKGLFKAEEDIAILKADITVAVHTAFAATPEHPPRGRGCGLRELGGDARVAC